MIIVYEWYTSISLYVSVSVCNISFIVTLTGVNYDDCQLRCQLRQLINSLISSVVSLLFNNTNPLQYHHRYGAFKTSAFISSVYYIYLFECLVRFTFIQLTSLISHWQMSRKEPCGINTVLSNWSVSVVLGRLVAVRQRHTSLGGICVIKSELVGLLVWLCQ